MSFPRTLTTVLSMALAVAVAVAIAVALAPASPALAPTSPARVPASASRVRTCTIAAAGDVAGRKDYKDGAARTARLILSENPGTVVALGDLAYDKGTAHEFATYYRPTWGQFEKRTQAVAGNHEYRTAGADGMEAELGRASNNNRAITRCGWRLVFLNQYKGTKKAVAYMKRQRRAYPTAPMLVAWHEPRFSSGEEHGSKTGMQPLWAAARANRVRIVLNAHDHDYERFAPMNVNGKATAKGTRQFVSGLGGHSIRPFGRVQPNSRVRYTGKPAVLFLSLQSTGGYSWKLKRDDGAVRDSGTQAP
jgi:hypothetical protein